VGGAKALRASTAGHRGCSRVTEEQNRDNLLQSKSLHQIKTVEVNFEDINIIQP
jgi:hypothetical protein